VPEENGNPLIRVKIFYSSGRPGPFDARNISGLSGYRPCGFEP